MGCSCDADADDDDRYRILLPVCPPCHRYRHRQRGIKADANVKYEMGWPRKPLANIDFAAASAADQTSHSQCPLAAKVACCFQLTNRVHSAAVIGWFGTVGGGNFSSRVLRTLQQIEDIHHHHQHIYDIIYVHTRRQSLACSGTSSVHSRDDVNHGS